MNQGQTAEHNAAHYLQQAGLDIITRNYHSPYGEIDLIAHDGVCIVFVEVRLRSHGSFGEGYATVGKNKQQKIIKTALYYLQQQKIFENKPCRFDIVSLQSPTQVMWIKDAFQT